jgi:hypothetical protein
MMIPWTTARDPLSPGSLPLAEAFLAPLHAAGMAERQAALAFRLIYDGFSGSGVRRSPVGGWRCV